MADGIDTPLEEVRRRLQGGLPQRLRDAVAVRLSLLHQHPGDPARARCGQRRSFEQAGQAQGGPGQARVRRSRRTHQARREPQAIGDTYITEVAKAPDGAFYNKVTKVVHDVSQTLGLSKAEFTKMGIGSRDVPNCP
jgi:hypothetical protein